MFNNTRAAAKIRGVGERASGSDFTVFPCTCSWEIYWPVVAAIFFILRKSVALYCLSYLTFIPGAGLPENYDGGGGGAKVELTLKPKIIPILGQFGTPQKYTSKMTSNSYPKSTQVQK